eukprot:2205899-Pyramimonas_sp.AAC.1
MLTLWPSAFQSPRMIQSRARALHAATRFASAHRIERLAPATPMPGTVYTPTTIRPPGAPQ